MARHTALEQSVCSTDGKNNGEQICWVGGFSFMSGHLVCGTYFLAFTETSPDDQLFPLFSCCTINNTINTTLHLRGICCCSGGFLFSWFCFISNLSHTLEGGFNWRKRKPAGGKPSRRHRVNEIAAPAPFDDFSSGAPFFFALFASRSLLLHFV